MEKEDKKDTLHISKQQFKYHWNSHQKKSRPEDSGTFLECWKEKEERGKKKKKKKVTPEFYIQWKYLSQMEAD